MTYRDLYRPVALLRRLRRQEQGMAAVELVVALPVLLVLMMMGFELGLAMVRITMLERATDITVRDVRIGRIAAGDYETMRDNICRHARIIPECGTRLKLEVKVTDPYSGWNPLPLKADCAELKLVDVTNEDGTTSKELQTFNSDPNRFDSAAGNQLVMLRSCASVLPLSGSGVVGKALTTDQETGSRKLAYNLTAVNSYVMEP